MSANGIQPSPAISLSGHQRQIKISYIRLLEDRGVINVDWTGWANNISTIQPRRQGFERRVAASNHGVYADRSRLSKDRNQFVQRVRRPSSRSRHDFYSRGRPGKDSRSRSPERSSTRPVRERSPLLPCRRPPEAQSLLSEARRLSDERRRLTAKPGVSENPIHPCLRQSCFVVDGQAISDEVFERLVPSLQIASCLLDDPRVIPFFNGLLQKPRSRRNIKPDESKAFGPFVHTFSDCQPMTDQDYLRVHRSIVDCTPLLRWSFDYAHQKAIDDSSYGFFRGEAVDQTRGGYIQLNYDFLRVFKGELDAGQLLSRYELGKPLDNFAAVTRTAFLMAITIIHEFTHAYCWIYYMSPDAGATVIIDEPFYRDHRVSEVGYALEQYIFGCIWDSIAGHSRAPNIDCAYGISVCQFPGGFTGNAFMAILKQPSERERKSTAWAVHMESVLKFFVNEFWQNEMRFSGIGSFKPRLAVEWQDFFWV